MSTTPKPPTCVAVRNPGEANKDMWWVFQEDTAPEGFEWCGQDAPYRVTNPGRPTPFYLCATHMLPWLDNPANKIEWWPASAAL